MNSFVQKAGASACIVAVLVMLGGHWAVLQSVAWGTMLVRYAQEGSLLSAVAKTFDGEHPCKLCLKVQEGVQEQNEQEKVPQTTRLNNLPECLWQFRTASLPLPPTLVPEQHPVIPALHSDVCDTPPTPPPRG